MSILKRLKLYRIKTVLVYVVDSWNNSKFVLKQDSSQKRIPVYFDLIRSFVKLGADFNDYCTFSFWNKTKEEKNSFITLRRNDQLRYGFSTPKVYDLLLDKAAFNERYCKWVKRGWISSTRSSIDEIEAFIDKYDSVIAKPLTDFGGHGVVKISKNDERRLAKIDSVKKYIGSGTQYIIEEVIENSENIKRLAPASLNTVRLVTVIDKNKSLHIIASLLRMGNGKAVTDNYHDGGMACEIDLDTLTLKGVAKGMNCVTHAVHPFSNIRFDGYKVPEVKECLDILKEVAFTEPEARYVGWDFAITKEGRIELLEGNIPPGEDITQLNSKRGLWHEMLEWK